jgi:hypothetical protein
MRWDGEGKKVHVIALTSPLCLSLYPSFSPTNTQTVDHLLRGEIARYSLREEHLFLGECRDATSCGALVIASVQGAVILLLWGSIYLTP